MGEKYAQEEHTKPVGSMNAAEIEEFLAKGKPCGWRA